MGSQLVRDAVYRVSVLLGDTKPQFVEWGEREIIHWFNDGQRVIAKYLPHSCVRVDAVKLVPGTRQSIRQLPAARLIPGDGSAAVETQGFMLQDVIRNLGTDGQTPGYVVRLVPRRDLDAMSPNWHVTPGDGTVEQYVFDPRFPTEFYVQPGIPPATDAWVEVAYQAIPADIPNTGTPGGELYRVAGSNAQGFSVGDLFIDDLVSYVMARAWLKDQQRAAAGAPYLPQFLSSINAQAKAMTGVNPNLKALPLSVEPAAAAS